MFIFDLGTKQKRQITRSAARNNCLDPSWFPDGRSIAYFTGPNADQIGGEPKPKGVDQTPVWSPDGKWIAFQCYQRKPDAFDLCVVDVEGKQVRQVTNTPKLHERHPVWGR